MQTKFVAANGLRFEVLEQGTGVRLALCLHGFPEHAISWRHQIPVLAGMGYRVWAVNQRGYGRTTRPTHVADYALPHLVDDVTALIKAARAKNVALIGHDWGAMVAWCVAAQQRRPLDRLVIMNDPHPLCFRAALKHWRQMRKSWYVAFFQLPKLPERMLTMTSDASLGGECHDRVQRLAHRLLIGFEPRLPFRRDQIARARTARNGGIVDTGRYGSLVLQRPDGVHQPPPRDRDHQVARCEILKRAVGDVAHALGDCRILRKHPVDARVADRALGFAIDQIIVSLVGDRSPAAKPVGGVRQGRAHPVE